MGPPNWEYHDQKVKRENAFMHQFILDPGHYRPLWVEFVCVEDLNLTPQPMRHPEMHVDPKKAQRDVDRRLRIADQLLTDMSDSQDVILMSHPPERVPIQNLAPHPDGNRATRAAAERAARRERWTEDPRSQAWLGSDPWSQYREQRAASSSWDQGWSHDSWRESQQDQSWNDQGWSSQSQGWSEPVQTYTGHADSQRPRHSGVVLRPRVDHEDIEDPNTEYPYDPEAFTYDEDDAEDVDSLNEGQDYSPSDIVVRPPGSPVRGRSNAASHSGNRDSRADEAFFNSLRRR